MFNEIKESTALNTNNLINIDSHVINTNNQNKVQTTKKYNKFMANTDPPKIPHNVITLNTLDNMLEKEKNFNKNDSWNKLDKTIKNQKLHTFAEKYGNENHLSLKEIKLLKLFFNDCLEKDKLQKTKQIIYNKNINEITSIPSLFFNTTTHNFTLKNTDPKRVSALKSLTPKRIHHNNSDSIALTSEI